MRPGIAASAPSPDAGIESAAAATDAQATPGAPGGAAELLNLEDVERQAIAAALRKTGNNKAAAARLLGIARKTLYEKIKRFALAQP